MSEPTQTPPIVAQAPVVAAAPVEEVKVAPVVAAAPVEEVKVPAVEGEPDAAPFNGLHVLVQYFADSNPDRQAEYDFCVKANLANPNILKVHCLLEPSIVAPDWLREHPKYIEHRVLNRLTYKQAFEYANAVLTGEIVALMNLDIFIDHNVDWSNAPSLLDMGIVLCLSRHEFDGVGASTKDKKLQNLAYANAQDAWVFRSPLFVKECDFKTGMLGCDNAIAHRIKISGYIPVNSPNEFKIHHFDRCRGKEGGNYLTHHDANPERPEDRGFYLLPDFSAIKSVDDLIERMGLGHIHRYRVICDVMTNYIRLSNPKPNEK